MSKYLIVDSSDCQCNDCASSEGYFKIKNYFNELKNDVERANARFNLGISDEWSLKWGNISGYIENQKDLTQQLDKFITVYKQEIDETLGILRQQLEDKVQEQVDILEEQREYANQLIEKLESIQVDVDLQLDKKVDKSELPNILNPYNHPYTNSSYPNIKSVGDALDQLLYTDLVISVKSNPTAGEIGETIPTVTFSWTYNKPIVAQTLDSINYNIGVRSKEYYNVNTPISKVLSASDGTKTKNATLSFNFKLACYYGVSSNTQFTSEYIINSFTRDLNFQKGSTITLNAQEGQYIYLLLPQSMSDISFYVGGFEGGFQIVDNNFQFSRYGKTNSYILFRSDNAGLGETTINTK